MWKTASCVNVFYVSLRLDADDNWARGTNLLRTNNGLEAVAIRKRVRCRHDVSHDNPFCVSKMVLFGLIDTDIDSNVVQLIEV